ncbi:MAG: DUF2788 domain-containing protein [Halioglobus sp.]
MDAWLTEYGVTLGVGALILFMLFIVWDLAKRSQAGKFGTLILYIGLAMGIAGFVIKIIITYLLENAATISPQ